VVLLAVGGCGSSAALPTGTLRTPAAVAACLRTRYVTPASLPPPSRGVLGRRSLLGIVQSVSGTGDTIFVYTSRGAAAEAFARDASTPELGAGNAVIEVSGDGPPRPAEDRCAFGAAVRAAQSAGYRAAYAHPDSGRAVVLRTGCLACHVIGDQGNNGPGPPLTRIGARLSSAAIAHTVVAPLAPMPSYRALRQSNPAAFRALVSYLTGLR
jgi:mono/diheme cytochrome c family protein